MSGSPKNVQRDFILFDPDQTGLNPNSATETLLTTDALNIMADPSVYDDVAEAVVAPGSQLTISANSKKAMGCYIYQPVADRVPYRIKAHMALAASGFRLAIAIGYAPASPTGSDDAISSARYIPFTGEFDDLILVPAQGSGDTYFGRALAVAIVWITSGTGITTAYFDGHLSVQRLATKPPTMHNAVS